MTPYEWRTKRDPSMTQLDAALWFKVVPATYYRWERDGKFPKTIEKLLQEKEK